MRNVTTAFRRTLTDINRKWLPYVDITLLDGTVLPQFTDATLWTSGLSFEDVVSEDEKFTALGAAIMGAATVVIDNTGEKWNDYDFNDADVTIRLGLEVNGAPEVLRIGQYTVAEAKYNGATVTLTLQDYMHQFDRAYDTALVYPATLGVILRDACTNCGVLYDNSLLEFTNNDYTVAAKPDGENTTYRDVVAWVAQLAGCFAKFNATGKLEFKWFGDDILTAVRQGYDGGEFDPANPYATGDNAEGGSFNPWNIGAELDGGALTDNGNCHYIGSLFSETIALDNTVITGVTVSAEREGDNGRETVTATSGTTGYVIGIEGNKLISADDVQTFATYLGTRVIGLTFRKSRVTHLSDPSIEAGDVALLFDHKSREYPILITRTRFTTGGRQETVCGSETPARNRAKQFSQETKNYVDLRRQLKKAQTAWNLAEASLRQQLQTASGLYKTEVEEPAGSGAYKTYLHDKAELEDSNIVMLFTDYGFTLTSDYQNGQNATWYGIGADGTGILDVLQTKGVNADWINAGTLQDKNGSNFRLNLATGQTDIKKGSINLGAYTENGTTKYHFSVDDNGGLNANNANIKGHIEATSLTLGSGVTIPYGLVSGTPDLTEYIREDGTVGALPSTGVQDTNMTGFQVSSAGLLKAANAIIYGTIYSSAGRIGGWTIASNKITKGTLGSSNSFHIVANGDSGSASIAGSSSKSDWCLGIGSKFGVDKTGSLFATGAEISGTINTVDGNYETTMDDGWIYFRYNNANVGKIGSALVSGLGNAFNINMMSGANGFGIYDGDGSNASSILTYNKSRREWVCTGNKFYLTNGSTNYISVVNDEVYVNGSKVVTVNDLNLYTGGYVKWANGDNGRLDGT